MFKFLLTVWDLGPVHMIPGKLIAKGQLTDPGVNFASMHSLTPVTVHIRFSLLWGNCQHRVTRLAEVTFLHVNRTQSCPGLRAVLRILVINICIKFLNKKFQKAPEIGKLV